MDIEQQDYFQSFVRFCTDGWTAGWHEANGGNASYRLTNKQVNASRSFFDFSTQWIDIGIQANNLAGEYFLVTGAGQFMKNVAANPSKTLAVIEIDELGSSYRIVWGFDVGGTVTSEFVCHFAIHSVRKQVSGNRERLVYHCHPTDLIVMTNIISPLDQKCQAGKIVRSRLTATLWKTMIECAVMFPEGLGYVGIAAPGSLELADATAKQMEAARIVVWSHHGLVVSGESFDDVFGLAQVVVKASSVYVKLRAVNGGENAAFPMTSNDVVAIAKKLNVLINEKILEE